MIILIAFCSFLAQGQCNLSPTIIYPDTLCPGNVDTIYTQNFDTYQWFKNNQPVVGGTNQFLEIVNNGPNLYWVRVTHDTCVENSDTIGLAPIAHLGAFASIRPYSPIFETPCLADTFLLTIDGWQGYWLVNDTIFSDSNQMHMSYDVLGGDEFKLQGCTNPIGPMCPNFIDCLPYALIDYDEDCLGTNVQELVTEKIAISPNPTTGRLQINAHTAKIEKIQVYQINGKQIYPPVNNSMIDLTLFSKGMYVIEVKTENGVEHIKVMKH